MRGSVHLAFQDDTLSFYQSPPSCPHDLGFQRLEDGVPVAGVQTRAASSGASEPPQRMQDGRRSTVEIRCSWRSVEKLSRSFLRVLFLLQTSDPPSPRQYATVWMLPRSSCDLHHFAAAARDDGDRAKGPAGVMSKQHGILRQEVDRPKTSKSSRSSSHPRRGVPRWIQHSPWERGELRLQ
jgi:hypothetical protein